MQIGIIGGGAAGLCSAWLLDDLHDVTLFEKQDRFGGHAHTVQVEAFGQQFVVDAGVEFFGAVNAYKGFNRLLDALNIERQPADATLTVYHSHVEHQCPMVMPPYKNRRLLWSSVTPQAICKMLLLSHFVTVAKTLLQRRDTSITIEDFINQQRLPKRFVEAFLYPLLLSFWCVELDEFKTYAAYNAVYYLVINEARGLRPPVQSRINGGLRTYVEALLKTAPRTQFKRSVDIVRVTRVNDLYRIDDADGNSYSFDHLIVATNARQAEHLLKSVAEAEPVRQQLAQFDYANTRIAIHGDRRLMPENEALWSSVNVRWDGRHSALSVWNPAGKVPLFKSWVTYEEHLPDPLFALANYEHVKVTPAYFAAQHKLSALQGQNQLWLGGLYSYDVDSHESAVQSAVRIVQKLAPNSPRLKSLLGNEGSS